MQAEPEVMSQLAKLLEPLDNPARCRVLAWAVSELETPALPQTAAERLTVPAASKPRTSNALRLSDAVAEWLTDEQDYVV